MHYCTLYQENKDHSVPPLSRSAGEREHVCGQREKGIAEAPAAGRGWSQGVLVGVLAALLVVLVARVSCLVWLCQDVSMIVPLINAC